MTDRKKYIIQVAKTLLSVCDGAVRLDFQGYNKFDAPVVRDILFYEDDEITLEEAEKLRKILLKYKRQIEAMGFDYTLLQEPLIKEEVSVWIEGNALHIKTPYNKELIQKIKQIQGRKWTGTKWIIKITSSNREDVQNLVKFIEELYSVKFNITLPEVSFGKVLIEDDIIKFKTEYNKKFIREIKELHGRWSGREGLWWIRIQSLKHAQEILKFIERWELENKEEAKKFLQKKIKEFETEKQRKLELLEKSKQVKTSLEIPVPEGLQLYPFQKVGVEWLEKTQGRALIADEMGLGKTIQILAWLYNHPEIRPVLVVCPNSVKLNWAREIKKWTGEEAFIIYGRGLNGNNKISPGFSFYIINYDILKDRVEELKKINFTMLILDESHYIKNYKAKRTKAAQELAKNIPKIACLTGTPLLNRPIELWTTLQVLKPKEKDFQDFWRFVKKYCDAHLERWGWDFSGASNLDELQVKLRQTIMIRRLKKDVLKELPPKRKIMVPMNIDNEEEYISALYDFRNWYRKHGGKDISDRAELLVKLEKLKQIAVRGKMQYVIDFIKNTLENEEKVVVFAHHREIQETLAKEFNALQITGGMDAKKKQKIIDEFNNGARIIVVSIKAGSEGINLQSARVAIFVELPWTPSALRQAEDRIHRIGQERRVDIYYLLASETVEEHIWDLIQKKQEIISAAIDGIEDKEKVHIASEVAKKVLKEGKFAKKLIVGTEDEDKL